MWKKLIYILIILIGTPVLAGLFGIGHDQVSSSISPEYFTRFKFDQFDVAPALPFRVAVAVVGWKASWWAGIPMGIALAIAALFQKPELILRFYLKSVFLIFIFALCSGLTGLIYGKFYLADQVDYLYIPRDVIHKDRFIVVGAIHNFSYLGGAIGLVAAIAVRIFHSLKLKR